MKIFILIVAVLVGSGCTTLDTAKTKGAERIAQGVSYVCGDVSTNLREEIIEEVNELAAPDSMAVTCAP